MHRIADAARRVTGGVDTHALVHMAAVVDQVGRALGSEEFAASAEGHTAALTWMRAYGELVKVGVEGTGSYGAGLARHLAAQGVEVVEVIRPNRQARRRRGKSDPADAVAAALAALNGEASGAPKAHDGAVESVRALRVARRGAVKASTQAANQLRDLIVTAPEQLRAKLSPLSSARRLALAARFRPGDLSDPCEATKAAMAAVARRHQQLQTEIERLDAALEILVERTAPQEFLAKQGVGLQVATTLLSPPSATTPNGSARRRASPPSAAPARWTPPPASSAATASTAAATGKPTPRSGGLSSCAWHTTRAPEPTSPDAPPRARPPRRSCAASSATSPARSTRRWSPTARPPLAGPISGAREAPWSAADLAALFDRNATSRTGFAPAEKHSLPRRSGCHPAVRT